MKKIRDLKKINITLDINSDLLKQAEILKIDISNALEFTLKQELKLINKKNI